MSAISPTPNAAPSIAKRFRANLQTYALIFATILIWGFFFAMTDGAYLSAQNFSNLFRQMTVTALLSCGMVLVIVTGGIDLSVGNFAGFVSVVVAKLQADVWTVVLPGQVVLPAILSVVVGLAVGILFGMLQGSIIAYLRVPAFIVTLGGMWVFKGLLLIVPKGRPSRPTNPSFRRSPKDICLLWSDGSLPPRDRGFSHLQSVQQPPEETSLWH